MQETKFGNEKHTNKDKLLAKKKELDDKHADLLDECLDVILEGGNSKSIFEEMERIRIEIKLINQELESLEGRI